MVKKKKIVVLFGLTMICATTIIGLTCYNNGAVIANATCSHDHVEHYEATIDHVEHWACCECHEAWSDSTRKNNIGNTVSNRSRIDVPCNYSFNETTGNIEYGRDGGVVGTIVPNAVVSTMKYHAKNDNVVQFEAADTLEQYVTEELTILNPENVFDTFGLSDYAKSHLAYWNDSHTFGWQEGGAFAAFDFGKFIAGQNLVLTASSKYYVVKTLGIAASERIGDFINVAGFYVNKIVGNMAHNQNFYVDLGANVNKTSWTGGDYNGTDWRYNTGTSYRIDKISNGVTTEYVHVTNSVPANGTWPEGIVEESITCGSTDFIRTGFDHTKIAANDKFVFKAGSVLTDLDRNAILAKEDITVIFDGSKFIELPSTYSYNESTGKIEVKQNNVLKKVIVPNAYVSTMKFHGNNNNVVQFAAADSLEKYVAQELTILNPENVVDTFGLSDYSKSHLAYWSDSHTFGWQEGGVFANFGFGKFIVGQNLVLNAGENYYVLGLLGVVCSERIGIMINVSGYFLGTLVGTMEHNSNYYADLGIKVDRTFWTGGDETGTDWTYNGGTSYVINKVHEGVTSELVHVTNGYPANGTFPEGVKEATIKAAASYLRLGIDGTKIVSGDQIVLKAGSVFTDDGNGKDAVLVTHDITLTFDGSGFVM